MVKTNICEVNFLEYAANRVLCVATNYNYLTKLDRATEAGKSEKAIAQLYSEFGIT